MATNSSYHRRMITLPRAAGTVLLAVATLAVMAVPASASVPSGECPAGSTFDQATEQCVETPAPAPTPAPTPAPVDACPDEALNPGVQAAGPCAVAAPPEEAFVDPAV